MATPGKVEPASLVQLGSASTWAVPFDQTLGRSLKAQAERLLSGLQHLNLEFVIKLDGQGPVIEPIAGQG